MSPLSKVLRIVVVLMGSLFVLVFMLAIGRLTLSEMLSGFGLLSFFGLAVCALNVSNLESTGAAAEAKQQHKATEIIGKAGMLFFVLSDVIDIATDNRDPTPLLLLVLYLPLLVWLAGDIGKQAFVSITQWRKRP